MSTRKQYVALVDSVRDNNGDVRIFSSLHVSGERKYLLSPVCSFISCTLTCCSLVNTKGNYTNIYSLSSFVTNHLKFMSDNYSEPMDLEIK